MVQFLADLERTRRAVSPRYQPPPTPRRARMIHGAVMMLWVLLFMRAFDGGGVWAWSIGLAYIGYDTALLLFVFVQTLTLVRRAQPHCVTPHPRIGVVIAAHNEAAVLPMTLATLFAQTAPPDEVIIADDGSDDGTSALLVGSYGMRAPASGGLSDPSVLHPTLRWLRLPRGGKAQALNAALGHLTAEVVLTVDADTLPEPDALSAMRHEFAIRSDLVAATGVLFPVCGHTIRGRLFQWFQSYEYMRNFLSRYAWARQDGLLLISGAFAAYRRDALLAVGGFDTDCLVEDYELTHRLLNHAVVQGYHWRTDVIGGARAHTDAPATLAAFLAQRRRWFGGFLQTQLWYRHMIGNPAYGRLGTRMLPVKAFDTMQPIFGLSGVALLLIYFLAGKAKVIDPAAGVIGGKIALDLAFYLWSLLLYRRWLGPSARIGLLSAVLAALIEPFSFQILRHAGAALGWVSFLTRQAAWGQQVRSLESPRGAAEEASASFLKKRSKKLLFIWLGSPS